MPDLTRIAVFGGVYSNHLALEATLADAERQSAQAIYCLGDIGGFGPHPDLAADRLRESEVQVVQGNYDDSVGNGLDDCQCGYSDPRDNHFAQISFEYTLNGTSERNRNWMRSLPTQRRIQLGGRKLLLAHGSPRRANEFLWESTCSDAFLDRLLREHECDVLLVTHSGLHWQRVLQEAPARAVVNVGAIGRPANDGDPAVHYALLSVDDGRLHVEFRRVEYEFERLAREMESEDLPEEFVRTIRSGWWTSCLEILPARERAAGRY